MSVSNIKNSSGFTLIEIAVVLVIIGFLVGSFIGTFAERIDTTRRDNTKKELDEIKTVLMAYAFSQTPPSLPCPDANTPPDGLEDRVGGVCSAATGFLPWATIGAGYADAWDTRYLYWVNFNYANNVTGFQITTNDGTGSAIVETRIGNNNVVILSNAVAVIYSPGKNGLGGISVDDVNRDTLPAIGNGYDDENENADADNLFMSRSLTKEGAAVTGGIFDDIVTWINSYELKAKMVETGKLP